MRDLRVYEGIVYGNCKCELQVRTPCLENLWTFLDSLVLVSGSKYQKIMDGLANMNASGETLMQGTRMIFLIVFTFLTEQLA